MTTSWRSDVRGSLYALLQTFDAAQSGLHQVYRARPGSFGSSPCAYVGGISEALVHTSGVRQRNVTVEMVLVDVLSDNAETTDRMDDLTDALLDALTADPHATGTNTVQEPVSVEPVELDVGGTPYAAVVISIRAAIQEARI